MEEQRDRDEGDIRGDRMREREKEKRRERERETVCRRNKKERMESRGWLARAKGDEDWFIAGI